MAQSFHAVSSRSAAPPAAHEVYAALDLGTNNCRLLVARPAADGFQVIDAFSRVVCLGEGVELNGRLSEAAIARTLAALKICARKCRRHQVTRLRAVATEACRRAANGAEFIARVAGETGIALETISAREEANLAIHGCSTLIDPSLPDALIFDIGGGSTEISWIAVGGKVDFPRGGRRLALRDVWSVPIGVVSLAERHGGRQVSARRYAEMIAEVRAAVRPFEGRHRLSVLARAGRLQMLGTSGTVTTLAGVHQRLRRYDRAKIDGYYLERDTIFDLSARIASMDYQQRRAQGCIGRERADLVIAGCAILRALCETWPVGRLRVADRGLREGMLLTMMQRGLPRAAAGAPGQLAG